MKNSFFLIILLLPSVLSAQIKYSVGVGSGLYFTGQSAVYDNSQKYFTGLLKLDYNIKEKDYKAGFDIFALPELYGSDELVRSLKLKIDADYYEAHENFTWGIEFSKKYYLFNSFDVDNTFDIYFVQPSIEWRLTDDIPVKTSVGLAYQDISGGYSQKSDLFYLDNRLFHYFNAFTHLSYGFYLERFGLNSTKTNNGWRIGPIFTFNHLKSFVLNLEFKYLLHTSKLTNKFSHESVIRLMAGKFLLPNLSAFLIADYDWRNISYSDSSDVLPYSLIDSENNIHVRLGYNVSKVTELYLKGGYFNQDYLNNNLSLKGWNIVAGVKFGN